MAPTAIHVSVEEYLGTMYHPDCDYVDRELEDRNMGEWDHGKCQLAIGSYFYSRRHELSLHVATELRIRVAPGCYRIPDVCVIVGPEPKEPSRGAWIYSEGSEFEAKDGKLRAAHIEVPLAELFD